MRAFPEVVDEFENRFVPERSLKQRMDALQTANAVRTYRANLKRDLKAGRKTIQDILHNPPEQIETMKLFDLLMAVPKIGRTKVNKMMFKIHMSPSKTVGGISDRQRNELLALLRR